jgi:hypothetical protein
MCFPSGALPTSRPKPDTRVPETPPFTSDLGGALVLENLPGRCPFVGNQTNGARVGLFSAEQEAERWGVPHARSRCRSRSDRLLDRRHVIVSCYGTHPPSQSKLNSARDRRVGLSAIGQCLKDQYDALATPIPTHLAALVKQLETWK